MNPQKTNEALNLDTKKANIEQAQTNEIIIPQSEVLKKYEQYDLFEKTIKLDTNKETRDKLFVILSSIPSDELDMYMMMEASNTNLIDKQAINSFITEKGKAYLPKEIKIENQKVNEKKFNSDFASDATITDKGQEEGEKKKAEEEKKKAEEEKKKAEEEKKKDTKIEITQRLINKNYEKYNEIFKGSEYLTLINKITNLYKSHTDGTYKGEDFYKDYKDASDNLIKWLEQDGNAQKIFDSISKSNLSKEEKKELYKETYSLFENIGINSNLLPISKEYVETKDLDTPPPYFPTAKEGEVTKRGDIVTYGDASVDLSTGKAYITSENGYKLETHMEKLDAMPIRIKYQKERLDILEKLETEKSFQKNAETTLKYINEDKVFDKKKDLEKELENKKSEKKSDKKTADDLQLDLEINQLEKELELVNKKIEEIKKAFPKATNQTEDDYIESLGKFLETKLINTKENIEKLEKQLEKNKENYEKEISDLLEKNGKAVNDSFEKTRQTTLLLDSIGFTLIPQHITDDIIATINKNPLHYGFESRIDLKNGNFGGQNTLPTKERFIKKFNKMISGKEGEPITSEDINNILVKKLEKDKDSQEERNKELLAKFSTYNIMSDLGTWDREKLESNLTLKEKETTNKETK